MDDAHRIHVADRGVPLLAVLDEVGVSHRGAFSQILCPIHKFGMESSPSAHVYDDNYVYCFMCGKQYGPVAIYAAVRGCDLATAADRLLEKWPVDPVTFESLAREYYVPKKPALDEALLIYFESHLLRYKLRVPLEAYRVWTQHFLALPKLLDGVSEEHQKRFIENVRNQMRNDLEPLIS